ncbi:NACHT domain-containing protein [uncultured Herbaspirillum sp.]|uniref:NACHT domain-containing protein n=1 Tax=uncultured Herbaspirillum sp. TaxID=160236 RepID=UPI00258E9606|nr:NACHT domain-containing protein [uncultured Herbaspirillum sp.]
MNKLRQATSRKELLLQKFQAMSEADFTLAVLKPLFQEMGYTFDYNGGAYEGGKDFICWKNGEFGVRELTVAQVKKTKATAAAGDSKSFSGIIQQLQQAAEKKVPYLTGDSTIPGKIYFITPYQIDTRALESRFEKLQDLAPRGIRVLDGSIIYDELEKRLPILVEQLCGEEFSIKHNLLANASNADLLSALNYSKEKSISDFYCDLDFGVGKVTSKLFFDLSFSPSNKTIAVNSTQWPSIHDLARRVLEKTGIDVLIPSIDKTVLAYDAECILWQSPENQETVSRCLSIASEIERLLKFILNESTEILTDATTISSSHHGFARGSQRNLTDSERSRLNQIKAAKENLESDLSSWFKSGEITSAEINEIRTVLVAAEAQVKSLQNESHILTPSAASRLSTLTKYLAEMNELYESLRIQAEKHTPSPMYRCSLDGGKIAEKLVIYKNFISCGIERLSKKELDREQIKKYFLECQEIFKIVGDILDHPVFAEAAGISASQKFTAKPPQRIHMPIREVFATGIPCAVYGKAGAGKSTTLFRYASQASANDKSDEITLFLPLTRLLKNVRPNSGAVDEYLPPPKKLEAYIAKFLNHEQKRSDESYVKLLKEKSRVAFIFDGVDEVIKSAPWIIDAIYGIEKYYKDCQIILSARSSGTYLDSSHYLSITLLPFTDEQVINFIDGWFREKHETAEKVKAHLAITPVLAEIVRSPLLATVLCVLAENEVPLPATELNMFEERLKLLLGHYDIHKKTKRLTSHSNLLEEIATKLAFQLHERNIRSAPLLSLERFAIKAFEKKANRLQEEQIRTAVRELVDPCNILSPMTPEGDLGFDHLRFQEYLCAIELRQNRGIDLIPLLSSPWWRSVLVLFAILTDDIQPIIAEVISRVDNFSECEETLMALIATRGKRERMELKALIERHIRTTRLDEELKEWDEYDTEDLDFINSFR